MRRVHRLGDDDNRKKAEDIAHELLRHSELPLANRASACMVLGLSMDTRYLEYAKEGVRSVQLGLDHMASQGREPGAADL